jgi:trk system potassium uptake protein TrkA
VTLIERDLKLGEALQEESDLQVITGSGTCPKLLTEVKAPEMDMVIAVTNSDEANLLSCWLITQLHQEANPDHPAPILYARVRNSSLERYVKNNKSLGIDYIVNPERLCVDKIIERLTYNHLVDTLTFEKGLLNLYGVKIPPSSPVVGQPLYALTQGKDITIAAMSKHQSAETIIPSKDDKIEAYMDIYFCSTRHSFPKIYRELCGAPTQTTKVYVAGASELGVEIAHRLAEHNSEELTSDYEGATEPTDKRFDVSLFDDDEALIEQMEQGDRRGIVGYFCDKLSDLSALQEYTITEADVMISCSDDPADNLVSALLAKELGFQRAVVLTNNERHHAVIREIGFEVAMSPRQIAVVELSQKINSDLSIAFQSLTGAEEIEVREFYVGSDNPFIGKTLADLSQSDKWPDQGALVAAILRASEAVMLSGGTEILELDRLFIISHTKQFKQIESLFEPKRQGRRFWQRREG